MAFTACSENEPPQTDFGLDYQPLVVGSYWKYKVLETRVFGQDDTETENFFYRDRIDYRYQNAENKEVFVLTREKSSDGIFWKLQGNFALEIRNNALVRTMENKRTVNLVFPPKIGLSWDANIYGTQQEDLFTINLLGKYELEGQGFSNSVRVLKEEGDDKITYIDNRYEVFSKGIGMIEQYDEVFTYCSRNDCLGQQIIESGRFTHLKIIEYGKN
ncbi:hypothetical protein [Rhodonellum sp.]|uniref:hypothetical protein n=1 Tax=Rhodonellum sp. TaxID=2231180 RepID=UPI00271E3DA8|nr:hypothetical protein [Rhodonellum sp.]MDO9553029.1 hypothetical protein [Rhodonellum sp.]